MWVEALNFIMRKVILFFNFMEHFMELIRYVLQVRRDGCSNGHYQ